MLGGMFRIGFGYDSHRFAAGRRLVLCGVEVPSEQGLAGHSDADAALHAVTDAILGAVGAGDIGEHFPDTDPRWAGADSGAFISCAIDLAGRDGWRVANCDLTILTEAPKLREHKPAMRRRLAELLRVEAGAVSVKAKTNEKMGFVGRGEGLAALAAVMLVREN
jgi:2-C-methyl-D-erythritol 4-phosphate cytidylyltransferase/2-C-methyl-D-erythritol 2,4-cyclodiphosphate synthase